MVEGTWAGARAGVDPSPRSWRCLLMPAACIAWLPMMDASDASAPELRIYIPLPLMQLQPCTCICNQNMHSAHLCCQPAPHSHPHAPRVTPRVTPNALPQGSPQGSPTSTVVLIWRMLLGALEAPRPTALSVPALIIVPFNVAAEPPAAALPHAHTCLFTLLCGKPFVTAIWGG